MQLSLNQSFLLTLNLHPNHTLKLQCYQQYNYVCLGSTLIKHEFKREVISTSFLTRRLF